MGAASNQAYLHVAQFVAVEVHVSQLNSHNKQTWVVAGEIINYRILQTTENYRLQKNL